MGQATTARLSGLSAGNARGALLGAATTTVVAVALVLAALGVTTAEVAATLLFLPVFAAGLFVGRTAGYVAAGVATVLYLTLRSGDLSGAGIASAGVMALTRAGAYGVAAHVGALARTLVGDGASVVGGARGRAPGSSRPADARRPPPVRWDEPWAADEVAATADDRTQPVMAVVGSPGGIASFEAGEAEYGDGPMTMSGGWPPDPPCEHAPEAATGSSARRGPARAGEGAHAGTGGWSDAAPGGGGWAGSGPDEAYDAPWGDDTRSAATDDWDAVQESWRRQNGLPPDEGEAEPPRPAAHDDFWSEVPTRGRRAPASDPWGTPPVNGGDRAPVSDPWRTPPVNGGRAPASDPWGTPPVNGGRAPASDPWGTPPADRGAPHPSDPWGTPAHGGGAPASDPWGTSPAERGAPGSDPWGTPPSGGRAPASDPWGTPPADGGVPPASDPWGTPASGGRAPVSDPWGTPAHGGGAPASDPWGTPSAPSPSGWEAPNPATQPPGPATPWSGLSSDTWSPAGAPSHQVWDDPAAGKVAGDDDRWSAPAPAGEPWPDPSAPAVPDGGAGWPASGSVPAPGPRPSAPAPGHRAPAPAGAAEPVDLPSVDPETGLWTAKFLRDRLSSERARSQRSGRPCSMVLVQVPDGPLAQLPYRRQVTLLRELGYQFVAGGVVDHLVHVPDRQQHWFAVILPDTDRSGAQVLERRLRLGIGGYLASRGLRLRDLESASLTAPDDDPAMGQIWEALIGPDGGGSPGATERY